MLERTKTPPIEALNVICPSTVYPAVLHFLESQGCTVEKMWSAEDVCDFQPSNCLRGARCKEGVTQGELAAKTGISRRHISEMENAKRPIGKANAKKLGEALNINYRVFL